ncbi:MAG: energy transducer TonB [Bacteroidia bacterium]
MPEETLFNQWTNVVAQGRNDLVFEYKHKDYGAYQIRRSYNRTIFIALVISAASFFLAVSIPAIIDWINRHNQEIAPPVDNTPVTLTPPPPIDPKEPPPPPPPPPPQLATVKFTPPVVTDKPVDEDPPPLQTEVTPQISTETNAGDPNAEVVIPENTGPAVVEEAVEAPLVIVEQMPEFVGGEAARAQWIKKEIEKRGYPQMEKEAGIQGTVYLTFVVEKDGSITDVKVLRGVSGGPGYDKLALAVAKAMPPWQVGKQNGRAVRVQFNMPIRFSVQ